jgi:hypothetical protein
MLPHSVPQSIIAFQVRYDVPFIWAVSRSGGEYTTHSLLQKYQRERLAIDPLLASYKSCVDDHHSKLVLQKEFQMDFRQKSLIHTYNARI